MRRALPVVGLCLLATAAQAQRAPHPVGNPSVTGSTLNQPMDDGSTVAAPIAKLNAISGSITHAGRTTTPVTLSYSSVAVGGSVATTPASDSVSGPAQIGDDCNVASASATPLTPTMRFTCAITATGTASITAFPTLGVALGSQSVSVNVFWRG